MGGGRWGVYPCRARRSSRAPGERTQAQSPARMKAVLDAGAFVAVEKRDRRIGALLRVLQQRRVPLWTSAAVVAQVWRDGRKQALLAQLLDGVAVRALASGDDRRTGELLARTTTKDVIDGHLALAVDRG